ncbi:AAA family ATPase [Acetobacterium sp.]|uniref:AAA family ATPase n=1 Tax=Acetobacterium sp. TaxID=1872094 RepID=UPI0027174F91|nr:AAA family ATPase [Acetobacterium sp.]MDO9492121.1 AAA family ATPase [Acetobacterium sp.]
MRPIRLKIKGINSFQEEQLIDFETLTKAGIFGIFGPTGSGKSTILDGITLALYGKLSRNSTNYINVNEEKASVVYEFIIAGAEEKTYQVSREFKRNKNEGINQGKCQLLELRPEGPLVLADKTTEVTNTCEEIIGLGLTDFTRTVVLPQGKFSDFLKLEGKPRRDMLERLFNLSKYGDDLSNRLKSERINEIEKLNQIVGSMNTYEGVSPEALAEKQDSYTQNHQQLKENRERFEKLNAELLEVKVLMGLLTEQKTTRDEVRNLEIKQTEIAEKEQQVVLGKKALEVRPFLEAFETLKNQVEASQNSLIGSEEKLVQLLVEKEACEKNFKQTDDYKSENLFKFQSKLEKVADAILWKEAQLALEMEIRELNKKMDAENHHKISLENEKTRLTQELEKAKKLLDEQRREEKQCRIESDHREKINRGMAITEEITRLKNEIENDTMRLAKNQTEINKLLESEQNLTEQKQVKESEQAVINQALNAHEKARPATWDSIGKEKEESIRIKNVFLKQRASRESLTALESQIDTLIQTIETKKSTEKLLKEKKAAVEEELMLLENKHMELILRKQLRAGESCPVCGSTEHPLTADPDESDDAIRTEVIKNAHLQQEQELAELAAEIAQLTGSFTILVENQKNLKSEIASLGEPIPEGQPKLLETANTELSQTMEAWEQLLKKMETRNHEAKNQLLKLEGDLKEKTAGKQALLLQTRELEELKKNKETASRELIAEGAELRIKLKVPKAFDFHTANETIKKMDQRRGELMDSLEKLEKGLNAHQQQLEKLGETIHGINRQLQEYLLLIGEKARQFKEKRIAIEEKLGKDYELNELGELKDKFCGNIKWIENAWNTAKKKLETAQEEYAKNQETVTIKKANLQTLQRQFETTEIAQRKQLDALGFKDLTTAVNACIDDQTIKNLEIEIDNFYQNRTKLNGKLEDLNKKINGREMTAAAYDEICSSHQLLEESLEQQKTLEIRLKTSIDELKKRLAELANYLEQKEKVDHRLALIADLEKLFSGKRFVEFVAVSRLKYISIEASKRLTDISNGNYGLEADDEGKFIIRDYKNGGAARDASTLSGGETFLASLSLALALSAEIQLKGRAPLEFFFLDEGFGSLHEDALEVVMNSIEMLHNDRLKVGIISHVESIKNRMPVKLLITPGEAGVGGSKVRIEK